MPDVNRLESIAKYVAIVSALVATSVGIGQFRRGVSQSVRELEWRQAEMRTIINGMLSDAGCAAMSMLGWEEGRIYEMAPGTKVRILPSDVAPALEAALQTKGLQRTETERFIGDRYCRFPVPGEPAAMVRESLDAWRRCSPG